MDSYELIRFISESTKKTPVEVYLKGDLAKVSFGEAKFFGNNKFGTIFCELKVWEEIKQKYNEVIEDFYIKMDRRNSAIPLLDYKDINGLLGLDILINGRFLIDLEEMELKMK